jgi:hypothetical protein
VNICVGWWYATNGDPTRLHSLGDFSNQLDLEQAIIEGRTLYLNVISQAELPFELASGDAAIQVLSLCLFDLGAFDGDNVLLGGDGNLFRREAGRNCLSLSALQG